MPLTELDTHGLHPSMVGAIANIVDTMHGRLSGKHSVTVEACIKCAFCVSSKQE